MAVYSQSFVLLASLLLLISISANEEKDCMVPVTDPTTLFGQSDTATPPLVEKTVDEYSACNNLCCQTENCNVVVFLNSVEEDGNNCILYACHPTETCNIHAQDGRLIFISQSTSDSEEFTSTTNVTTSTTTTTNGADDETDDLVTTESPLPEKINQTELNNITSNANTTPTPVINTATITTSTPGLNVDTSQTIPSSPTTNTTTTTTTTTPTLPVLVTSQSSNTITTTPIILTPTVPPPPPPPPTTTTTIISANNESTIDSNSTITDPASEGNNTNNENNSSVTPVSIKPSPSNDMESTDSPSPVLNPTSVTLFSNDIDKMAHSTVANVNLSTASSPDLSSQNLTTHTIKASSDLQSSTHSTLDNAAMLLTLTPSMTFNPTLETLTSNMSLTSSAQEMAKVSSTVTYDEIPQSSSKVDSSPMSTSQPEPVETDLVETPTIIETSASFNDTQNATLSQDASETTDSSEAMTAILICALTFGCVFMLAVVGVLGKRIYDGYKKRHYSRLDYLINGMYN